MPGGPIIIIDPKSNRVISGLGRAETAQAMREAADRLEADEMDLEVSDVEDDRS